MNRRGFSILEMVVVVVIVGLMVVIAMPNLRRWASDQALRSAAAQVEGDIQIARLTAINRNAPVTVRFAAPPGNSYEIFVDDGAGSGGVARNLTRDGTEELVIARTLDPGIILADVDFNGNAENAFLFNGRGLRANPTTGNAFAQLRNDLGTTTTVSVTLVGDVDVQRP